MIIEITKADFKKKGDYSDNINCLLATALKRKGFKVGFKPGDFRVAPLNIVREKRLGFPLIFRFTNSKKIDDAYDLQRGQKFVPFKVSILGLRKPK